MRVCSIVRVKLVKLVKLVKQGNCLKEDLEVLRASVLVLHRRTDLAQLGDLLQRLYTSAYVSIRQCHSLESPPVEHWSRHRAPPPPRTAPSLQRLPRCPENDFFWGDSLFLQNVRNYFFRGET